MTDTLRSGFGGNRLAFGGTRRTGVHSGPAPHYLLAFLAASLLGRRSCTVSSATAGRDRRNFAREVSQVETPGAAIAARPTEAQGASPTSHQYVGGGVNPPACRTSRLVSSAASPERFLRTTRREESAALRGAEDPENCRDEAPLGCCVERPGSSPAGEETTTTGPREQQLSQPTT